MAIDLGDGILAIKGDAGPINATFANMSKQVGIAMTAVGAAITVALGAAVVKATEFGENVGNVATLGIQNLAGLKDGVMEVSKSVGTDLNDGMKGLYDIISAGIPEGNAIEFLGKAAIASKAGVGELSDAVDLGTTIMNAFGLEAKDTTMIFDQTQMAIKLGKTNIAELGAAVGKVAPLLKGAGVASEEMFAALAQLTVGGLSTSESVTGLRAILNSILKPTSEAEKMAAELGIQWDSSALASKGLSGMMSELSEKTGGNIDKISALIPSVEAMPAAFSLMSNSGADLASKLDMVRNSTGASQEAYEAWVAANPGEAFDRFRITVEALGIRIGDALIPQLVKLVDFGLPIVNWIIKMVEEHPKWTTAIVATAAALGGILVVLGPLMIMMPGIISTIGLFTGGLTAVAGAATVAAPAVAGVGVAAVAATAPLWAVIAAGVALGVLLGTLTISVITLIQAKKELRESEERLQTQLEAGNKRLGIHAKTQEEFVQKATELMRQKREAQEGAATAEVAALEKVENVEQELAWNRETRAGQMIARVRTTTGEVIQTEEQLSDTRLAAMAAEHAAINQMQYEKSIDLAHSKQIAAEKVKVYEKEGGDLKALLDDLSKAHEDGAIQVIDSMTGERVHIESASEAIKKAMEKISPYHAESPSLVEQTVSGLSAMADAWSQFTGWLDGILGGLWDKLMQVGSAVGGILGFGGGAPAGEPIGGMQHGGPVTETGVYTVGEEGPETVILPKGAEVIPYGGGLAEGTGGYSNEDAVAADIAKAKDDEIRMMEHRLEKMIDLLKASEDEGERASLKKQIESYEQQIAKKEDERVAPRGMGNENIMWEMRRAEVLDQVNNILQQSIAFETQRAMVFSEVSKGGAGGGNVIVNVAELHVREEADVDRVSQSLYNEIVRELSGTGLQLGFA